MVDYSNKVCEACSADAPKATQSEIEDFLKIIVNGICLQM